MKKIYSLLLGLRDNIPQEKHVSRKYVDQYNSLIDQLSEIINSSLDDFKVSDSVLEYTCGVSRQGGGFQPFGDKKCERGFLLTKLYAILILFKLDEGEHSIGFQAPKT